MRYVAATALLCAAISACDELTPIEPGPDTGPVTAYVDGEAFIASSVSVRNVQGQVRITAVSGSTEIRLYFEGSGPNNYVIGPGNPVDARVTLGTETWTADAGTGSGTITVTDFIPSFLSGSFDLTVVGSDESSLRVEQGRFVILGF